MKRHFTRCLTFAMLAAMFGDLNCTIAGGQYSGLPDWASSAHEKKNTSAEQSIEIETDFPGSNVVVDKIVGDTVFVRPDLRDTQGKWFYWYFAARGTAGRTRTFDFGQNVMAAKGPAVSLDDGETWKWLESANEKGSAFSYTFPADATSVRFCVAMPYLESHLNSFLANYDGSPHFKRDVLCQTAKGREVELLHIGCLDGSPRHRVLLTCRHHACETTASYVLEGILKTTLDETPDGKWFQENVELLVVPFIDKDGVEDGDQGKSRKPHDHNRDYGPDSIYYSVKALKELATRMSYGRLTIALDLHCPLLRGPKNEVLFFLGSKLPDIWAQERIFCDSLESVATGPLVYKTKDNMAYGQGWNKPGNLPQELTCAGWLCKLPGIKLATTLEIPYATVRSTAITADSARLLGQDLARAMRKYLESQGE